MSVRSARTSTHPPSTAHPRSRSRAASWATLGLLGLVVAGCGNDEATVATGLGLSRVVTGQGVDLRLERETVDAAALRTNALDAIAAADGTGGVNAAPTTVAPIAPPTLAAVTPTSPPPTTPAGAATAPTVSVPAPVDATAPVTAAPTVTTPATAENPGTATVPASGGAPVATTPGATTATSAPPATADPAELAAGEEQSLVLINQLRSDLGLPALTRDPTMDAFARDWSRHMAESGQFDHSPSPYGENIAFTSNVKLTAAEAAESFQRLWSESEDHYKNMTSPYATVGIGVYKSERGWYGTHVYSY